MAGRELTAPRARGLEALIPDTTGRASSPHASRAALELAILDCALAAPGDRSPSSCRRGGPVTYSGIITAGSLPAPSSTPAR